MAAVIDSLDCPQCGAPLPLVLSQTLTACLYCNATVRIVPGAAPTAAPVAQRAGDVPPAVVDEVKRKLLLSQRPAAVDYYAKEAHVPTHEAEQVVKAIARTMAYYPPLRAHGVALFLVLDLFGMLGIIGGGLILRQGNWPIGTVVVLICALFTAANTFLLARGIPGYMLSLRGTPAQAVVLKTWLIRTDRVRGEAVHLTRMLLEVRPAGGKPYQAESNIYVRAASKAKFAPGATIRVKFDPLTPKQVVVEGPGTPAEAA